MNKLLVLVAFASIFCTLQVQAEDTIPKAGTSEAFPAAVDGPEQVFGGYTDGCIYGATAFETSTATHELVNNRRNHQYGHSELISVVKELGQYAKEQGWGKLTVGDASAPTGGKMIRGHTSHRVGLDVDIFFRFVPFDKTLTLEERNSWDDDEQKRHEIVRYTKGVTAEATPHMSDKYLKLIEKAAGFPRVERVFVSPPIKRELCAANPGHPEWLKKVRPWDGHRSHFHIRLKCPENSPLCRKQGAVYAEESDKTGVGCGGHDFEKWFKKRKPADPKPQPTPKVAPIPLPYPKFPRNGVPTAPTLTTPEVTNPAEPEEPEGPDEEKPEAVIPRPRPLPYMPEWKRKCLLLNYTTFVRLSPDVRCLTSQEQPPLTLKCRDYKNATTFTRTSKCGVAETEANPADCAPN